MRDLKKYSGYFVNFFYRKPFNIYLSTYSSFRFLRIIKKHLAICFIRRWNLSFLKSRLTFFKNITKQLHPRSPWNMGKGQVRVRLGQEDKSVPPNTHTRHSPAELWKLSPFPSLCIVLSTKYPSIFFSY